MSNGAAARWPNRIVMPAGGFSAALGLAVMAGWHTGSPLLLHIHPAFVPMAIHTAVGFSALGIGIMAFAWSDGRAGEPGAPLWLPIPVGVGALTASLCLWQAMVAQELAHARRIERAFASESAVVREATR